MCGRTVDKQPGTSWPALLGAAFMAGGCTEEPIRESCSTEPECEKPLINIVVRLDHRLIPSREGDPAEHFSEEVGEHRQA